MTYYTDGYRHLICVPFSKGNLHLMAKELNIKKCWFHSNHYDIPKSRIEEIENKCEFMSIREIFKIIEENNEKRIK